MNIHVKSCNNENINLDLDGNLSKVKCVKVYKAISYKLKKNILYDNVLYKYLFDRKPIHFLQILSMHFIIHDCYTQSE